MRELVVGRIESIVALRGLTDVDVWAWLDAADPIILVPLAIIVLAIAELRRCVRAGWHRLEDHEPAAR